MCCKVAKERRGGMRAAARYRTANSNWNGTSSTSVHSGPEKSKTGLNHSSPPRRQLSARALKAADPHLAEVRKANESGKVKRPELIAAVLQSNPRMTVQKLITALNKEFGWKTTASGLTAHLYTNPDRFTHTEADRSGKNPIRWSLK
jgi:hypothetical protein